MKAIIYMKNNKKKEITLFIINSIVSYIIPKVFVNFKKIGNFIHKIKIIMITLYFTTNIY